MHQRPSSDQRIYNIWHRFIQIQHVVHTNVSEDRRCTTDSCTVSTLGWTDLQECSVRSQWASASRAPISEILLWGKHQRRLWDQHWGSRENLILGLGNSQRGRREYLGNSNCQYRGLIQKIRERARGQEHHVALCKDAIRCETHMEKDLVGIREMHHKLRGYTQTRRRHEGQGDYHVLAPKPIEANPEIVVNPNCRELCTANSRGARGGSITR